MTRVYRWSPRVIVVNLRNFNGTMIPWSMNPARELFASFVAPFAGDVLVLIFTCFSFSFQVRFVFVGIDGQSRSNCGFRSSIERLRPPIWNLFCNFQFINSPVVMRKINLSSRNLISKIPHVFLNMIYYTRMSQIIIFHVPIYFWNSFSLSFSV